MKNNLRKLLASAAALAVILLVLLSGCGDKKTADVSSEVPSSSSSQTQSVIGTGAKDVTIVVKINDEEKTFACKTDVEFLGDLLREAKLAEGDDTEYGMMITAVNGVKADAEKHEYWAIYVNGEYGQYGADSQPIAAGDVFTLALETY